MRTAAKQRNKYRLSGKISFKLKEGNTMKIKVLYHSSTGNTRKVAEAISSALNVKAEMITASYKLLEPVDLLFIGDGIYAAKMSRKTKAFIGTLDSSLVKNAAVFGTCGGQDKVIGTMKGLLKDKGINVCDESFLCKGRAWFFVNRNHPDKADLEGAVRFGQDVVGAVS